MDKVDYIIYGIIIIICLLIININISITNSTISGFDSGGNWSGGSNWSSGGAFTFTPYTSDQIIQNWNATGCTIPLTNDIVTSLKQTIYASTHSKHHRNFLTYKVKRGDTLGGIAAKFNGASIERIRAINGIKRDRLHPGMTIKI